jgi:hypothetical protein
MVDPLRSAFFSTRFVRLAHTLGEPRRLCIALAGEATQLCHTLGDAARGRVAHLLAQAEEIADRLDDAHARAFVLVMSGTVAYLQGQWRRATQQTDAAIGQLQTGCTGVAWELTTAHTIGFVARCLLGEWAESARRLPDLIRDAEARGDRYAHHSLRVLGCAYVLDLAADAPEKARRELATDLAAWSYKYYDIQRATAALASVDISLYEDQAEGAVAVVRAEWDLLRRSQLLRIPTTFSFTYAARARAVLALASRANLNRALRESLLTEVTGIASTLMKRGPSWSHGLAALFNAGVASCRGNQDEAVQRLWDAESLLTATDLIPYAMAARWRLAQSGVPGHDRARDVVEQWVARQRIVRPEKVARGLAPGCWS